MVLLPFALAVLAMPPGVDGQPAGKVARVGILSEGAAPSGDEAKRLRLPFLAPLRDLGWIPGQNIVFERRYAAGQTDRLGALAADLVQLPVSVIVAFGTPASLAAKDATATIPIVFVVADPVGTGLVVSLARPGGNITGLTTEAGLEWIGKGLELLKEAAPGTSRVGILWNTSDPAEARVLESVPARALGLTLLPVEVRSPGDLGGALAVLSRERADAMVVAAAHRPTMEQRQLIVDFAAKNRLPTLFGERAFVAAGELMSYGPVSAAVFRRTAVYVDKILRGVKPGDLPVEQPTKFELVINMKTAKALGLSIPPSLLMRADQVIE